MRIVTRADFDGIVCAVLLKAAEGPALPILWADPGDMQRGLVAVQSGDIVANLPFDPRCALWFDHHISNKPEKPFRGLFEMAPSAAGLIHRHYRDRFKVDFSELVHQTDRIDSADLTQEEVLYPERFPHVLLSMTIANRDPQDEPYWNRLVDLLLRDPMADVMQNPEVQARCAQVEEENRAYRSLLQRHTTVLQGVAITDFRPLARNPRGNRFLVYSLYPQAFVQMKIHYDDYDRGTLIVSLGHSIFNRTCQVNVGLLLQHFEGGGHPGAGSCRFKTTLADVYLPQITAALIRNAPLDDQTR